MYTCRTKSPLNQTSRKICIVSSKLGIFSRLFTWAEVGLEASLFINIVGKDSYVGVDQITLSRVSRHVAEGEATMLASKRNVLVVEDEPLIRLVLTSALEDIGYAVFEAGTVLQAVALLSRHEIDGIVTDVDMPGGLSGLDLVDLIAGLNKPCGIVVASGSGLPADYELPAAAAFIPKPYALETVIQELEQRLPSREMAVAS